MFMTGTSCKPKESDLQLIPNKLAQSMQVGQDAMFQRWDSLGVADGVGGWTNVQDADPALYSFKLMNYSSTELVRPAYTG
jgi:hypothetical protein